MYGRPLLSARVMLIRSVSGVTACAAVRLKLIWVLLLMSFHWAAGNADRGELPTVKTVLVQGVIRGSEGCMVGSKPAFSKPEVVPSQAPIDQIGLTGGSVSARSGAAFDPAVTVTVWVPTASSF